MKINIKYQHTAHAIASRTVNRDEKELWFVFHGYGQLASFFIKKFRPFFHDERLIIAPEATNYGYLEGFSGRVGANWMTRHERETAIANNNAYLNALLESILIKYRKAPDVKVLGFSQGAATASRWVCQLPKPIACLVLWGGGFAHDLNFNGSKEKLQKTKVHIALGDQDEFITDESVEKQQELIETLGISVNMHAYKGGHDLEFNLLKELMEG